MCSGTSVPMTLPAPSSRPAIQAAILDNVSRYIRPGGLLLYSTCTVLEAENGEQALDLLDREHADLIVTDIMMPGMNGFEVAAALRRGGGA